MSHYFEHDENIKNHELDVTFSFNDITFNLVSNNGVFSKHNLDEGSSIFITSLLNYDFSKQDVLDLGCGYGPIGLVIKKFFPNANLLFSDVNESCIELTKKNLTRLGFEGDVILSDGFCNIEKKFDYILFNPPIRIGKEKIFSIYNDVKNHLKPSGHFLIVIRKDKGAESHKKYLLNLFSNFKFVKREKGYHVYEFQNI